MKPLPSHDALDFLVFVVLPVVAFWLLPVWVIVTSAVTIGATYFVIGNVVAKNWDRTSEEVKKRCWR